ncbi:hypothetical protein HAX54_021075, partial [Datura stramonium]|nr:hypothetical protein [Datura stramonium]
ASSGSNTTWHRVAAKGSRAMASVPRQRQAAVKHTSVEKYKPRYPHRLARR